MQLLDYLHYQILIKIFSLYAASSTFKNHWQVVIRASDRSFKHTKKYAWSLRITIMLDRDK